VQLGPHIDPWGESTQHLELESNSYFIFKTLKDRSNSLISPFMCEEKKIQVFHKNPLTFLHKEPSIKFSKSPRENAV
jgi:hypothetical protein